MLNKYKLRDRLKEIVKNDYSLNFLKGKEKNKYQCYFMFNNIDYKNRVQVSLVLNAIQENLDVEIILSAFPVLLKKNKVINKKVEKDIKCSKCGKPVVKKFLIADICYECFMINKITHTKEEIKNYINSKFKEVNINNPKGVMTIYSKKFNSLLKGILISNKFHNLTFENVKNRIDNLNIDLKIGELFKGA